MNDPRIIVPPVRVTDHPPIGGRLRAALLAAGLLAVAGLAFAPPYALTYAATYAQTGGPNDHGSHATPPPASSPATAPRPASADADADLADGEVRRIDRGAAKLTIRHGEIRHLDMPPMTMVFQVPDPTLFGDLKPGDRIRFLAEAIPGGYAVTAITVVTTRPSP